MLEHASSASPPTPAPSHAPWRPLGAVAPSALVDARVALHHAAQVANAAAISLLPPQPDDSHTAFAWEAAPDALVAQPVARGLRFALRVADLHLLALAEDGSAAGFALDGRSQADALAWVRSRVSAAGSDGARVTMRRHYAIEGAAPDAAHPWRLGDGGAYRELAAWYANAAALLADVTAGEPGAGPVRCWPHHFDLATLIVEPPDAADGARRTVGLGLSPGDGSYAEPYWYVGPYPYPRTDALPALRTGRWHTQGWVGAALTGSDVVAAGDAAAQERCARAFVDEAVATVRAVRAAEERTR